MKMAKIALAAAVAVLSSATFAQEATTGMITTINRISGTIAIQPTQDGTVGAATTGPAEVFKVQDGMLDDVHAGDRVTFSTTETGGTKTITKLEKLKS